MCLQSEAVVDVVLCCDVAVNELILKHRQRMLEQKKIKVEHLVGADMTRGHSIMCEILKTNCLSFLQTAAEIVHLFT